MSKGDITRQCAAWWCLAQDFRQRDRVDVNPRDCPLCCNLLWSVWDDSAWLYLFPVHPMLADVVEAIWEAGFPDGGTARSIVLPIVSPIFCFHYRTVPALCLDLRPEAPTNPWIASSPFGVAGMQTRNHDLREAILKRRGQREHAAAGSGYAARCATGGIVHQRVPEAVPCIGRRSALEDQLGGNPLRQGTV